MKLEMGYPDKEEEITILNRFLKDNPIEDISNVCSKEDIKAMKNEVKNIYIHPSLIEYIVKLAEVTRNMGSVAIGISPRGSIAMVNAARAMLMDVIMLFHQILKSLLYAYGDTDLYLIQE